MAMAVLGVAAPAGPWAPVTVAAQEATSVAGDTVVLTLDDALRIASSANPGYRRTVNEVGLNAVDTRATWANQVLPTARLGLFETNYTGNVQRIGVDDFGNPVAKPDADWFFRSRTSPSLSLNWTLQGTSVFDAVRSQSLTNRGRLLDEAVALTELTTQVRRRYYEVLRQRETVALEGALAEARRSELELARRLFALAGNTRVDVLQAELAVERQASAVRQQRNELERSRLALRTALGDGGLGPFRLADEPVPVFDPAELDADALVAMARDASPAARRARAAVESERVQVSSARNAWWPDLSVSYNVYRRTQEQETAGLFDPPFDQELEQSFSVSLGFPFFNDFFGNRREIETAEVALDNAEESLRETLIAADEAVRVALLELETQWESLRLARRSLEIAGEALELAREEYRLGTRTFAELQQTVESESEARRELLAARFGFVGALLDLEEAVGGPVRPAGPGR